MSKLSSLLLVAVLSGASAAQTLDTDLIATGFDDPVWVGSYPGDERIFVVEQDGRILHFREGQAPVLFLDIAGSVNSGGERGLLGMAFHPKFPQNGYFFVNYTRNPDGRTIVSRFEVSDADPDVADPASEVVFFMLNQPFSNHNAGDLAFGPLDGYLYIPTGDGGSGDDPGCRAQRLDRRHGKMLRIDVDEPDPGAGTEYSIPADNPFLGVGGAHPEIWALGLRNPFRFSFDRLTGDIYIGDVGQNSREEVSYEPALTPGRNYGWPVMEADECKPGNLTNCDNLGVNPPDCFAPEYTDPVHAYDLYVNGDCAVIGGVVYRGCRIPDLQGTYFFADHCGDHYWSLEVVGGVSTNFQDRTAQLGGAGNSPTDFGEDGEGEVLIATHNGRISRVVAASTPSITDCDGNGQDDDCEIATYAWADMDSSGVLDACESFSVDTDEVCVSLGGRQEWNLHAGAGLAGEGYLVLGSFAGTSPGVSFGPVNLPLNVDAYFTLTAQLANNGFPFVASFGVLDGAGEAQAAFDAPAGLLPPSVVGLTANHAYVVFDGSLDVLFASNYTGLAFAP